MKALLLAAGLGTRLRPITERVPKCLVPIAGKPLLSYWLDLLRHHGVDEVLLNTHYLAPAVAEFVATIKGLPRVRLFHEEELLGSAGTLAANAEFFASDESFIIAYADNLTDANLSALVAAHASRSFLLTMGLFISENPTACGIAELAADSTVINFEEKPKNPRSHWANAGIYVASSALMEFLPRTLPADIGKHLLPQLVGRMQGVPIKGYLRDIGTLESYEKAEEEVAGGLISIP